MSMPMPPATRMHRASAHTREYAHAPRPPSQYAQHAGQMLRRFTSYLRDPTDGLHAHGAYVPPSGAHLRSCCKWGRANGWGLLASFPTQSGVIPYAIIALRGRHSLPLAA